MGFGETEMGVGIADPSHLVTLHQSLHVNKPSVALHPYEVSVGVIAAATAQIELFPFAPIVQAELKLSPFLHLAQNWKRGEAAKMHIPLWEQGVGPLGFPRGIHVFGFAFQPRPIARGGAPPGLPVGWIASGGKPVAGHRRVSRNLVSRPVLLRDISAIQSYPWHTFVRHSLMK